jgi:hypothetical protein
MAIVYSYPGATPTLSDTLLGTQFDVDGNATKSFPIADIVNLTLNQNTIKAQPIKLTFNWNKANIGYTSAPAPSGIFQIKYYTLGIDFNGLTLENGVEYTLLIDRWRYNEKKTTGSLVTYREARYYHEVPFSAISKGRFSELPITSANGQYFDFIQPNYFTQGQHINGYFKSGSGKSENRSRSLSAALLYVNLSFRLRINRGGVITETDSLGTITLTANRPGGAVDYWVISYSYPKST